MRPAIETIALEYVRGVLGYDSDTGEFVRKNGPYAYRGKIAGFVHRTGYRILKIKSRQHLAHRVAWLLHYGEWPSIGFYVDHINRDKLDNRIANLRLATHAQNRANSKVQTASGYKGVYPVPRMQNKWQAQININGKTTNIGFFDTVEEAARAYREAATGLYGEFAKFV